MKLGNKLAIGGLAGFFIVGFDSTGEFGPSHLTDCEIFQGLDKGRFTFDEQTAEERGANRPNYSLTGGFGAYENIRSLNVGDKYRLKIANPRIGSLISPAFSEIMVSFEPCDYNSD